MFIIYKENTRESIACFFFLFKCALHTEPVLSSLALLSNYTNALRDFDPYSRAINIKIHTVTKAKGKIISMCIMIV